MIKTPSEGQELAIKFAMENKYSIIAMKPGQGKTLCAVEVAKRLKLNTLVVCPSYGRKTWLNEFSSQIPGISISNFKQGKEIYPVWDDGVCILSYSLLVERRKPSFDEKTKRADLLFEWADLVVFDECHYLKEQDNTRTKAAHKLVYENMNKYVMLLSGTPAKNRVHELYSQVAICHYKHEDSAFLKRFPTWVSFANHFSEKYYTMIRTKRGSFPKVNYRGLKNIKELGSILSQCYFKMPDKFEHKMPPKIIENIEADNIKNMPELVKELEKFLEKDGGISPTLKSQAALLSAKFTGRLARDLVDLHGSVVVFTDHIDACEQIVDNLNHFLKVPKFGPIHGNIPAKQREATLDMFQKGIIPAIVATTGTLSTSVDLTVSNAMIINDPPWVPGNLEQIEGRINRRGQNESCFYYRVMATVQSEKIYEVLASKSKTLKKIDEKMEELHVNRK